MSDTKPAASSGKLVTKKEIGMGNEMVMCGEGILRKYLMWVMLLLRAIKHNYEGNNEE